MTNVAYSIKHTFLRIAKRNRIPIGAVLMLHRIDNVDPNKC